MSRLCKRKHYEVYTPLEKVVVHEIYRAQIAINTVLIKCETDKLSDKTYIRNQVDILVHESALSFKKKRRAYHKN